MGRGPAALALSVLLVLLAVAPRAAAPIDRPRYTEGDFWTYDTSVTEEFGLGFTGNTTITAGEVVPIDVLGQAYDALELSVSGGGSFTGSFAGNVVSGTWSVTGVEHWETGAWNGVRSFLRLTAVGTFGSPTPLSFTLEFVNATSRRVTEDTFPWPIREGASGQTLARWNTSLNVTLLIDGNPPTWNQTWIDGNFTTAHAHNGTARISVPAGTFDTHAVREVGPEGGHRERWFAPRAGADAREWDYNDTGGRVAATELTAYRYAAGIPPPAFPWIYVLLAGLAVAIVILGLVAFWRRKPVEVWTPPAEEKRSP